MNVYHKQHARHADARGLGACHQKIFLKLHALRLNLRTIFNNAYDICITEINSLLTIVKFEFINAADQYH